LSGTFKNVWHMYYMHMYITILCFNTSIYFTTPGAAALHRMSKTSFEQKLANLTNNMSLEHTNTACNMVSEWFKACILYYVYSVRKQLA